MRWRERLKPAASVPTHLLLAGVMWSVVGAALAVVGALWIWQGEPRFAPWIAGAAVAVGLIKSRLVLDRAARRIIDRIRERGDGRCIGGFLSWRTWLLVALMAGGGRILRGTVAHGIVGPLYLAVGAGLLLSSRLAWSARTDAKRE